MKVIQTNSYEESARAAADILLAAVAETPGLLLGLATGGTVEGIYANIVADYKAGKVDFSQAHTVNLDEYVAGDEEHSYRKFMNDHLFDHVNVPQGAITIADRLADPDAEVVRLRRFFEENRVDIQLLGIGPNGHIGFNEPGAALAPHVHVETLTETTIAANARFFAKAEDVPRKAITMGMADIMNARRILLVAHGANKRDALKPLLDGSAVTPRNPASFLLLHPDVTVVWSE